MSMECAKWQDDLRYFLMFTLQNPITRHLMSHGPHSRVFCSIAMILASFLLVPPSYAQWPVQSCSSGHRIPVTVTATGGTHDVETRIDLLNSDFPADYGFSSDGSDVRVFAADDTTPVDFVVAGWDEVARQAVIYVRAPAIASGTSELMYIYFGDLGLASGASAASVFPDLGHRLRSRVSTADPTDAASALAAFAAATVDVADSVRPTVSGLNNQAIGGSNGNYGWCVSAIINVTAATTGVWGFRYGADFGRGGQLYVSGQALEEDWNDDLWWAGNFANTGETLEGTVDLGVGWHRYEALGFEGCCDGATGFQARAPGGAWLDLSTSNYLMRGAQCVNSAAIVTKAGFESCSNELLIEKTINADATSDSTFFIPGSVVRYDIDVSNPGQSVDAATLVLTDVFPAEVSLVVSGPGAFAFTDGGFSSGLGFSYGGPGDLSDSVTFSTDGSNFGYVPSSPVDDNVTHIRITPSGAFNPNDSGDIPSFSISILGVIQ